MFTTARVAWPYLSPAPAPSISASQHPPQARSKQPQLRLESHKSCGQRRAPSIQYLRFAPGNGDLSCPRDSSPNRLSLPPLSARHFQHPGQPHAASTGTSSSQSYAIDPNGGSSGDVKSQISRFGLLQYRRPRTPLVECPGSLIFCPLLLSIWSRYILFALVTLIAFSI
jgi:hypothetical protein